MANDLEIQGAIRRTKKGSVDWYEGGGEEAWQSLEIALQNIPDAVRVGKVIKVWVNHVIREYWWPTTDIGDLDIRVKIPPVSNEVVPNGEDAFSTGGAFTKFTEINQRFGVIEDRLDTQIGEGKVSVTSTLQYTPTTNLTNTLVLPQLIDKKVIFISRGLPIYIIDSNVLLAGQCKFTSSTGTLVFGANMYQNELITILYRDEESIEPTNPTIRYVDYLDDTIILDSNVYLTSDPSTTPNEITNLSDNTFLTDTSILTI